MDRHACRPETANEIMPASLLPVSDMKKLGLFLLLGLLAGCTGTTSVTGEWQAEAGQPAFDSLLVIGVTPSTRTRRSFETALVKLIRSQDTNATAAIVAAGNADRPTEESVRAMARAVGADGVLVTRLVARDVAPHETSSRVDVKTSRPAAEDGSPGLIGLFSLDYSELEDPGEFIAESKASTETALYDLRQGDRLVYQITTRSSFREGRDDIIADITRAIARQLTREGLIR